MQLKLLHAQLAQSVALLLRVLHLYKTLLTIEPINFTSIQRHRWLLDLLPGDFNPIPQTQRKRLNSMGNNWFLIPKPNPNARLRLFCFPYAGGNAGTYLAWAEKLHYQVELVALQLPGRATRIAEPAISDMHQMIEALLNQSTCFTQLPYVLFGHSLGSKVAYEFAANMCRQRNRPPSHVIVSGSGAPHLPVEHLPLYNLPEAEFIAKLEKLQGTPVEVLQNKELMAMLTPLIRADFKIADTYIPDASPIECPFTILGGTQDHDVTTEMLAAWNQLTSAPGKIHMIEGNHFFVEQNRAAVLYVVNQVLENVLSASTAKMRQTG
ncbi:thioesterase domain-containing protein [Rheinheimera baltica]|uniref:thioesterase II family protein n=1 Tax=Rheinheimera baltica TaxID=67576 RepID=UPI00273F9F35|nr:alpha/beta fold hydrolase [Rheinheimera baltica]MDP5142178.1 thioesterase domain-containing protein [Rheinheimera baltica]